MTILDQLARYAKERVEKDKKRISFEEVMDRAIKAGPGRGEAFYEVFAQDGIHFICEVKKASPSKGIIDPEFDYSNIALAYESAGADAISCLTEPRWFLGSDRIFEEIRAAVKTPMLRKDFVVDEYQLYQSRLMGADCVLLICSILDQEKLAAYLKIAHSLGLASLVETHDEEEIDLAIDCGARMIGVNNRNLKDFSVDVGNAARLRGKIPSDCLFIAESGVTGPDHVRLLRQAGANGILIGEAMMRAADKKAFLNRLKEASL